MTNGIHIIIVNPKNQSPMHEIQAIAETCVPGPSACFLCVWQTKHKSAQR